MRFSSSDETLGRRAPTRTRRASPCRPLLLLLAIIATTTLLAGCADCFGAAGPRPGPIIGSGRLVTKQIDLSNFNAVEARGAFKVDIVQTDAFSVAVTADDNLFAYLEVYKQAQTLILDLKPGTFARTAAEAQIGMPSLRRLDLSGAAKGTIASFKSPDSMEFDLSGASVLTGRIEAPDLDLTISGASRATLGGAATSLTLDESGASQASLGDLPLESVRALVSGASSATVNVSGRLDADLSGASTLYYVGNPTLGTISTSGASSLKRR